MTQHPNTVAAGSTGAALTLGVYIADSLGWHPPTTVTAAIVTLGTSFVLFLGRRRPKRA